VYPLFNSFLPLYLSSRFASASSIGTTYRNYAIISALGVPGSLIACFIVDWTRKSNHAADDLEEIQGDNEEKIRCQRLPKRWSVWQGLTVVGGEEAYYGCVNTADGSVLVLVYDESEPGCRARLLLCKWSYAVSTSPFCSSELVTER